MTTVAVYALAAAAGYLLGSLPVAVVVCRRFGVDPRAAGDGNPGYWNAKKLLGPRRALPVLVGDTAKGTAAGLVGVALGAALGRGPGSGLLGTALGRGPGSGLLGAALGRGPVWGLGGSAGGGRVVAYVAVGAAMVGHAWPLFARFAGGRSILTFAGGMSVLSPPTFAVGVGLCVVMSLLARSFAIGARVGVFSVPVLQVVFDGWRWAAATLLLMSLIGVRFAMAAVQRRGHDPGSGCVDS